MDVAKLTITLSVEEDSFSVEYDYDNIYSVCGGESGGVVGSFTSDILDKACGESGNNIERCVQYFLRETVSEAAEFSLTKSLRQGK